MFTATLSRLALCIAVDAARQVLPLLLKHAVHRYLTRSERKLDAPCALLMPTEVD